MTEKQKRNSVVAGICLVVALVAGIALVTSYSGADISNRIAGNTPDDLVTQKDVDINETTRHYFEHRIAVGEAAIKAREEVGQEDLLLLFAVASDASFVGDLEKARANYEAYLQVNPINYTIWTNYAGILAEMGDLEGAELAYLQAIDISATEDHFGRYLRFLNFYYQDGSRDEDVLATLELALASFGQKEWIMIDLAQWYEDHGECARAINHYEVAQQLNPANESIQKDIDRVRTQCNEGE